MRFLSEIRKKTKHNILNFSWSEQAFIQMVVTVTTMVANKYQAITSLDMSNGCHCDSRGHQTNARPSLNRPSLNGRHCDDCSHLK